ncbi:phage protein [Bordetella ansorpii]|uniref:Phage protein n=2 Tax=Bordetella ansorpii TaxID=288768 RepID=A0A157QKK8_9BORD|nr:phage protein [Bordetella ansorpii]
MQPIMDDNTTEIAGAREALHKKMDAEIARLIAETGKIAAETSKIAAEAGRISAEAGKITKETVWYPLLIVSGIFAAIGGAIKLFA